MLSRGKEGINERSQGGQMVGTKEGSEQGVMEPWNHGTVEPRNGSPRELKRVQILEVIGPDFLLLPGVGSLPGFQEAGGDNRRRRRASAAVMRGLMRWHRAHVWLIGMWGHYWL